MFLSLGRGGIVVGLLLAASAAQADVKLPSIFGDHMVLQQEAKLPVWGTADSGEKVTVKVGDHTALATAGNDGKWRVDLEPFPSGTPATVMTVQGKNALHFDDVLIGDVWLGSGQSNMEVELAYAYNAKEDTAKANDTQLRLFKIARTSALEPRSDVVAPWPWWELSQKDWRKTPEANRVNGAGTWIVCNSESASRFSAVAYFFGKELRARIKHPIGLIECAWGGSPAEAWVSLSGLQKGVPFSKHLAKYEANAAAFPKLNADYAERKAAYDAASRKWGAENAAFNAAMKDWQVAAEKAKAEGQPVPPKPSIGARPTAPALPDGGSAGPANLYHGMIAPLVPYGIKGVIWYQGENNTGEASLEYQALFGRLIGDWREKWGQGDFPFLYVQISHFLYLHDVTAPLVREAQLKTMASVPKTGMAVTVDIPADDGAHPRDKIDVGQRLALIARRIAYGEDVVDSGPVYQAMKVEKGAVVISFSHIHGGLVIGTTPYQPPTVPPLPKDKLVGFLIAGSDKKWLEADAKIEGDTLVVSSPQVPAPVAVRYGWENGPKCNLYSKSGLPASPFRTDDWQDTVFAPKAK